MTFINSSSYTHGHHERVGVLITNLGTPDQPTKSSLKQYLKEFLSDPRVVEMPRLLWWLILNGIILRIRPAKSAKAYQSVWTETGSPLMAITKQQAVALQAKLGESVVVEYAMRYGNPSVGNGIQTLLDKGVRKLLVVPLYPQYCASTTASTFDAIAHDFCQRRWLPELRFVSHYHDQPDYIQACVEQIKHHWQQHGQAEKLIFSYHGIPERYLNQGDPYYCECQKTSRLIASQLGLSKEQYLTSFQSRFGREQWLQPYTDETLKALPTQGTKSVQLFCPGFAADCLETIEEINVENRHYFLDAGGEKFDYIAALNAEPWHIEALAKIVATNISGWTPDNSERALQVEQAKLLGAER
ncbi:ferrochelatase [Halioxenophilus sp. WMMB6]|uniref:ferrochelatase n=1 Tax=Halioxenophilus sp. WMMB6 TaxID=3073815 RepID=UPI00295EA279|nr:ferrochelatase [Halioxenophilus sp. WMMB6]